jgi:hypothetical protein
MKNHGLEETMGDDFRDGELAKPGEPVFVLRGADKLAADAVMYWADLAQTAGVNPDKVAGARMIATEMRNYPHTKLPD